MPKNSLFATLICFLLSPCCGATLLVNRPDAGWKRDPSRLDRMPLNFGKRDSNLANSEATSAFGSKRLAKLNRMPLSFGKKSALFPNLNDNLASRETEDFQQATSWAKRSPLLAGEDLFPTVGKRWARLDRMPLTFGKRLPWAASSGVSRPSSEEEQEVDGTEDTLDETKSVLDRLPAFDEKPREDFDLWPGTCCQDQVDKRRAALLDRMPLSFGKRTWELAIDDDDDLTLTRRGVLNRMPLSFGKRAPQNFAIYKDTGKNFETTS
ncbi:hypothetical protein C0Q70_00816 [Pomacea canaliculata]|uniref:Uncharacterized protein n=2 Tax=Pomacea canaliculata TaxID=400727 RepID=A0A2T7PXQ1_POMCA|nr:hypothetical protein C0Q70_00816 [Pomacea canaliculata]